MSLEAIRIDERTWEDAELARRGEWCAAIREVLGHPEELCFVAGATLLRVSVSAQSTIFELVGADEATVATAIVPRSRLNDHVTEYVDIVRQIDRAEQGMASARLEALDMAKKLAHDDAARALQQSCPELGMDHPTARKLWTLLLTLRIDTTKLMGVRAHRPIR